MKFNTLLEKTKGKGTVRTQHHGNVPEILALLQPDRGPSDYRPSCSRTFFVIRSVTSSPPRRPCAQSVDPQVKTVPPRV